MGSGTLSELRRCPCGETPESIGVCACSPVKYCMAIPSCCGEWMIEFRANYAVGDELKELAEQAWNDAPRGGGE